MKYENYQQVQNLVKQIDKHQEKLNAMDSATYVQIMNRHETLFTIGTWTDCEHEYSVVAKKFLSVIRYDLEQRIKNLKSMLEAL